MSYPDRYRPRLGPSPRSARCFSLGSYCLTCRSTPSTSLVWPKGEQMDALFARWKRGVRRACPGSGGSAVEGGVGGRCPADLRLGPAPLRPYPRPGPAGRGPGARRLHELVRTPAGADRARRADDRLHCGVVVRRAVGVERAEPRLPPRRPAHGRERSGGRPGHRRTSARDPGGRPGAPDTRAAAGPARRTAGGARPAGQQHGRAGRPELGRAGPGDPRRHRGPGAGDQRSRRLGGEPRGEAARLRRGRPGRRRGPARRGREGVRGVDGHGERDAQDVHLAVLGRLHDEPDNGQRNGGVDGYGYGYACLG